MAQENYAILNQLLGGRYRVVQDLGEGGLAKTYIVEDHHRPGNPKCAVKFLKPASNDPDLLPTARRLFNKEAEILEKLGQHDQIPRLLAYFEENQEFYLVQEFIEGHPLSTELPRGQRWPESKVIQMLQDVLQILEFVHSYRVIHRDIKPSNLIRRQKDGRLVLIDFGAVKQIRDPRITTHAPLTHKTISIGTQGYMPTEQVRGKPRLNSDIYALGMIGIQALTGVDPICLQEDADGEVIWKDRAKVSYQLANILTNMVRYHFKDRYQSAKEVLEALNSLTNNHKLTQPPETVTKIARKTEKLTPEVAPEPELQETKMSQGTEKLSPTVVTQPPPIETKIARKPEKSRLLIGAGVASILVFIFVGYSYINYRQSYLQAQETLEQIEELKVTKQYSECLQQAQIFPKDYSNLNTKLETLLLECRQGEAKKQLSEAKKLAEQSKLKDAISIAAQIPKDIDVYVEAQTLIFKWSEKIFQIASNKYQEGKLEEAKAIANAVPDSSPLAKKVQTTIQQWDEEWQHNENYLQVAQKKLDERNWRDAIKEAQKVSKNDHWQKQSEQIIQKAEAEIRKIYSEPPKYASPKSPPKPSPKSIPKREPIPVDTPFPPKDGSSKQEWRCNKYLAPSHPSCAR